MGNGRFERWRLERAPVLRWSPMQAARSASALGLIRRRLIGITSNDVARVLDVIEAAGSRSVVAGGWGVDALFGRQRRRHIDLDLAVDDGTQNATTAAATALCGAGFGLVRVDNVSRAFFAQRQLYEDRWGRVVDLHPVYLGCEDNRRQPGVLRLGESAVVTGRIGRRSVTCLSVESQIDAYGRHPVRSTDQAELRGLEDLQADARDTQHCESQRRR